MPVSAANAPSATSVPIDGGRFLIVGGASLVGSASAQRFLEGGAAEVVVFDRLRKDRWPRSTISRPIRASGSWRGT